MIDATLYILGCSLRNRLRRSATRLREPRYLLAVATGGAYLYFVATMQTRLRSRAARPGRQASRSIFELFPMLLLVGPALAGLGLLVVAAGTWLFSGVWTLLDFNPAEVQFLLPAPVRPRGLMVYRMARSQFGMLFGSAILAVVVPFGGSGGARVQLSLTVWLLFFTARVYSSGVAMARARLSSRDPWMRLASRLPLVLVAGALVVAAGPFVRSIASAVGVNDWLSRAADTLLTGRARVALWPTTALVRPMFAGNWQEFGAWFAAALGVSAVIVAWVLANARTFDDLAREAAEQRTSEPRRKQTAYRARGHWTLAPTGRPEPAFAWKGLLQTLRVVEVRMVIRVALLVLWIGVVSSITSRGISATIGVFAMIAAGFGVILGPLVVRTDLRQDLRHLELLKTWPVRAAAIVRGEMIWPATLLTVIVWTMTVLALYMSTAVFSHASLVLRLSVAGAVCAVAPALISAQLAIHNTVALLFPAWVSFGDWRARGVDAIGQRLIVVGGTLLLVSIATLPGAVAGGLVWLAFARFIGPVALVPAAIIGSAILAVEVLLVTEAVGPAYERLDLTSVENAG